MELDNDILTEREKHHVRMSLIKKVKNPPSQVLEWQGLARDVLCWHKTCSKTGGTRNMLNTKGLRHA